MTTGGTTGGPLRHRVRERDGYPVLALHGDLTLLSSLELNRVLGKLLLDRGRVVVEVAALTASWLAGLAVFASALAQSGGWPLARLVLLGASPNLAESLRAAGLDQVVPLADTWEAAIALLHRRPARLARYVQLPCAVEAGSLARLAAADACADWGLTRLVLPAKVIATELVANAVGHARTCSTLTFDLIEPELRISVRDWAPVGPGGAPGLGRPVGRRRGLAMVEGLAGSWGVTRHEDGKTVWATLSATASRSTT